MSTTAAVVKRKFPPPCWTRDEALVLIQAYRERWYALNRAFLKNPDWDAVADKVTTACPDVTPPKTPAQCRHKMEKLRQRHRAEKLRAASFPNGQFFSSWFYFEAMEAMENGSSSDPVIKNHLSDHPGRGIRFKPTHLEKLVTLAATSPNLYTNNSRVSNDPSLYTNNWGNLEEGNEDGYLVDHTRYPGRIKSSFPSHHEGIDPRTVPRKFGKVDHDHDHEVDGNGDMWVKVPRNNSVNQGKKRVIHEVVASIKVLGDGFMKMEKMKIDMVREIERMRMEMEMKRNQLILESQRQIVEVFVKGLIESRKQQQQPAADS